MSKDLPIIARQPDPGESANAAAALLRDALASEGGWAAGWPEKGNGATGHTSARTSPTSAQFLAPTGGCCGETLYCNYCSRCLAALSEFQLTDKA